MLIAILHFFSEEDGPREIVSTLVDALPSGSYLTVSHLTADFDPEEAAGALAAGKNAGATYVPRSQAEVAAFFTGLDLVDPGVVPVLAWRPDDGAPENPRAARIYAAMGRKP
jgi:S-adenosyl methyltransferase